MKRLLVALLCLYAVPAIAADPTKPSKCNASAYMGTDAVLLKGERTEYVSARASVACSLSQRIVLGPVRLSVLAGTTLSAEGSEGAPVDARLYTLGGTLGVPLLDGGYLEAGGAYDQRVGGAAALFSASLPIKGAFTTLDVSLPIKRGALQERAYQLRVGASVRVKRLLF
jgi:hypothetical protein